MALLIRNGTVVNARDSASADVLIRGDRIVQIAPDLCASDADEVIDASGCLVMPGFIDTHTHFDLDTGTAVTADDFASGTAAALLGGTTTVLDFATQEPGGSLADAFHEWMRKAQGSSCNYGFHIAIARFDDAVSAEMEYMRSLGVTSYKLYMVYDALRVDDGAIFRALKRARELDSLVAVHCENYDLIRALSRELHERGLQGDPASHVRSRPNEVEAEAVNRLIYIARLAEAPAYIVHLSTKEALLEVRRHRAAFAEPEVFVETCPQYLTLHDELYDADGRKYIMSPPLRKPSDAEALWDALEDGNIDAIGTDHCSFTLAQKDAGAHDYALVPNGIPGVQHRVELMFSEGVLAGRCDPQKLVRLMAYNPAKLFGIRDRGVLASGAFADITIWSPEGSRIVTDADNAYKCGYSPYSGMTVRGRVRDVILNGVHCVHDGELLQMGCGRYLARGKSGAL
ncbi:MAG: dihydropyrimidinase [Clostridia bacterium]|nr:dihydropyrimidinase [Clostridia bacterium]